MNNLYSQSLGSMYLIQKLNVLKSNIAQIQKDPGLLKMINIKDGKGLLTAAMQIR